jgi:hypothetical protein
VVVPNPALASIEPVVKLQILSDSPLETGDYTPAQTDADVVVLAGDVHVGRRGRFGERQTTTTGISRQAEF